MTFRSYRSYSRFAEEVTRSRRFIRSAEQDDFLAALAASANSRVQVMAAATLFWRAQKGCDYRAYYQNDEYMDDLPVPFDVQRMTPRAGRASQGRANPQGIPVLYVTDDPDTAVAEVRPWIGAEISLGVFKSTQELRILNCAADDRRHFLFLEEPAPEIRERSVWADVNGAFARPVDPADDTAAYAPTQIITEHFKSRGFDGLCFRSSVGEGRNFALFHPTIAELVHCEVVRVKSLAIEVEPEGGPFSVWRK